MGERRRQVTARDLLEWVLHQHALTRDGVRMRRRWRGPVGDGPWDAVAADLRMMFESTVQIGAGGLDAPTVGDLGGLCSSDCDIDVPDWAAWRLT